MSLVHPFALMCDFTSLSLFWSLKLQYVDGRDEGVDDETLQGVSRSELKRQLREILMDDRIVRFVRRMRQRQESALIVSGICTWRIVGDLGSHVEGSAEDINSGPPTISWRWPGGWL